MKIHTFTVATTACLLLASCFPMEDEVTEPAPAEDVVINEVVEDLVDPEPLEISTANIGDRAEIDWEQARQDFATRDLSDDSSTFGVASGGEAPSVPVLLPTRPITTASADGSPTFKVIPMNDGYYAVFDGEAYDMIINGSDRIAPASAGDPTLDPSAFRFEETITGAQVSFKRYGASYLVEFNCKGRPPGPDSNCIDEDAAVAAVQDLLVAETQ